jgi:hypothetical protein
MVDNFYEPLTDDEYYAQFGVSNGEVTDEKKLKAAYNKAWEIRNFEITTLWTRVAYFWGFIAAIFAGYIAVMTCESDKARDMHLDLYLILLGFLFSVAWLLVIKGSKRHQETWEHHITCLEHYVSGPLYQTMYCTNKTFYSVTGVNETLAWVVIGVWVMLAAQYFYQRGIGGYAVIPLVLTAAALLALLTRRTGGKGYKTEIPEDRDGAFIHWSD